jgi:hypothetical protein
MTGKSAAIILRQMHSQVVVIYFFYSRTKPQSMTNTSISLHGFHVSLTIKTPFHMLNKKDSNPSI